MSVQINPVLEDRSQLDFDVHGGTAALNESEALCALADEIGVPALDDFFEFAHVVIPPDYAGSPDELYAGQSPAWFDPREGLKTIDALLPSLAQDSRILEMASLSDVEWSLHQLRRALTEALNRGTRFHFSVF